MKVVESLDIGIGKGCGECLKSVLLPPYYTDRSLEKEMEKKITHLSG
jgi:hypothetical protein